MAVAQKKAGKKRAIKEVRDGVVYISASFNNIIITITDRGGNTIAWGAAGSQFKGARQATPHAAQIIMTEVATKAKEQNKLTTADVIIRGPGGGRDSAVRALSAVGVTVTSVKDDTTHPHNGCRPRKKRRV